MYLFVVCLLGCVGTCIVTTCVLFHIILINNNYVSFKVSNERNNIIFTIWPLGARGRLL